MAAVILEWNPNRPSWNEAYPAVVAEVLQSGWYVARWPIDQVMDFPARTEVWLLVQGGGPNRRGLIGHGITIGESFAADHFEPRAGGPLMYVPVQFDLLLPEGEQLRTGQLTARVPGFDWEAEHRSGSGIPPHAEAAVRALWAEHVLDRASPYADTLGPIPGSYPEAALTRMAVNRYESNPEARAVAVAHHGPNCHACGFDFEATYGAVGAGFVHVHHTVPGSRLGSDDEFDPISDLVPLCPNCHYMAHRGGLAPYTVAELRAMIAAAGHSPGVLVTVDEQEAQDAAREISQASSAEDP